MIITPSFADDETGASDDSRSSSNSNSSSGGGKDSGDHTKHHRTPSDAEVHRRKQRGDTTLHPSCSDSDLPSGRVDQHDETPGSPANRKLSLDARTAPDARERRRRHGGSRRRESCGDKKSSGAPARVQWADEQQQVLVREHPRKRYERKPSLRGTDAPKPILKQS